MILTTVQSSMDQGVQASTSQSTKTTHVFESRGTQTSTATSSTTSSNDTRENTKNSTDSTDTVLGSETLPRNHDVPEDIS